MELMLASTVDANESIDDLENKFRPIRCELIDEYLQPHSAPWIIGYSGGKDSTLLLHIVVEMLMKLAPTERRRDVHVVANDTLVESPLIIKHINISIAEVQKAAVAFDLPITTAITRPLGDQSFWVNLIGRGYPSPNRSFRWCTDRMKILPTSRYIKEQADAAGQVILLLGVRRSESATRSSSIARYDNGMRLNRHNDLIGCMVFRPIVDLSTDDVWEFLGTHQPPWGGSHAKLIKLYRDAGGGECPVVTQKSDAPSCGTTSSRFGCWTCTVVEKDRSLEGFVESGFDEFGPMLDFRDWLASIRNEPPRRMARRRDGRVTITDGGTFVPGPYTLHTRSEILDRLRVVEKRVGHPLISDDEVALIRSLWARDAAEVGAQAPMAVRTIMKGR